MQTKSGFNVLTPEMQSLLIKARRSLDVMAHTAKNLKWKSTGNLNSEAKRFKTPTRGRGLY